MCDNAVEQNNQNTMSDTVMKYNKKHVAILFDMPNHYIVCPDSGIYHETYTCRQTSAGAGLNEAPPTPKGRKFHCLTTLLVVTFNLTTFSVIITLRHVPASSSVWAP